MCDRCFESSPTAGPRDQRIPIQVWVETQIPAISRFAKRNGDYQVYGTDMARLMRDQMLVVDYTLMRRLTEAANFDPDLRAYLEKRPLILMMPKGPIYPLSETELENRKYVGATIVGNDMNALAQALCSRQLTSEIQDFRLGVQITKEMMLDGELTLGGIPLPYRLRLHIEGCGGCRFRLEEQIVALNKELKLVTELSLFLVNEAHQLELKQKTRQRPASAEANDIAWELTQTIASALAETDPAAAAAFMESMGAGLGGGSMASAFEGIMGPNGGNPFGLPDMETILVEIDASNPGDAIETLMRRGIPRDAAQYMVETKIREAATSRFAGARG